MMNSNPLNDCPCRPPQADAIICSPCITAEADIPLNFIQGEPFDFDDLTPEQIALLQRPALSAANAANASAAFATEVATSSAEAEQERDAAEQLRHEAEVARNERFEAVMAELEPARMRPLVDLWNIACGKHGRYNEESGFFELNGLTDITYSEALQIFLSFSRSWNQSCLFRNSKARTNIPVEGSNFDTFATNAKSLEVAVITYVMQGSLDRAFYGCSKMHSCSIWIDSPSTVNGMFLGCVALVNLNLRGLNKSLDLRDSPLITSESFEYIITHRYGTTAFTIIVHPAVYAKLADSENAEWHALMELAEQKNITFST